MAAVASWMLRNSTLRSNRFHRSRHTNHEDDVSINISDDPKRNIREILLAICQDSEMSVGKRLNYLNAFVKVTLHINGEFEKIDFQMGDILVCLRIALLHHSTQVRSGGLRAIRHVIRNEDDILHLNRLLIPFLISRSLDLILRNDVERIESMKLLRKLLFLAPLKFHSSMARSLVALANSGVEDKDRLLRVCLATLCELAILNPQLFVEIGGVPAITRNLIECQTPRIGESLCGVLLWLLDRPCTRQTAAIDLHILAAPYCEFQQQNNRLSDKEKLDAREVRFNCSRMALLSVLRSWSGVMHFCHPQYRTGMRSIVDVLRVPQLEVRRAILDLLYDLIDLPQPEWTDEISVALTAIDPADFQSSWRLNDGFVAAEGHSILPHLARHTPSVHAMHLALLLGTFLECQLLSALVEVIATSDTFISVRATVLLGQLLHLVQRLLPPDCYPLTPALPSLLVYAVQNVPQAIAAIDGLQQLDKLLRLRPAACSLYLDVILRSGENPRFSHRSSAARGRSSNSSNSGGSASRSSDNSNNNSLKLKLQRFISGNDSDVILRDSGVLSSWDAYTWNWGLIRMILKGEAIELNLPEIAAHKLFLKNIVDFFMPSRNRYSHMDLCATSKPYTLTALELVDCLVALRTADSTNLLRDLFTDVIAQIVAITSGKSCHDCLFSPQHMNSTQCQSYFLLIGRLLSNAHDDTATMRLIETLSICRHLETLTTTAQHTCYAKVIITSLDYSRSTISRQLLRHLLRSTAVDVSIRLYAIQFLLVLLRADVTDTPIWAIEMLVEQLETSPPNCSVAIRSATERVLLEATESADCLYTLIRLNSPSVHQLVWLRVRLYSKRRGYALLEGGAVEEVQQWTENFNESYVDWMEGVISDGMTLLQRNEMTGKYDERVSSGAYTVNRHEVGACFVLPHLYGEMAQHAHGFKTLMTYGHVETLLQRIELGVCKTNTDILKLKSALWAVGHLGSTTEGLSLLKINASLVPILNLVQNSPVYSVRATAYYALGLIATTKPGADLLFSLGWFCTRHDRHIIWPIIEDENWAISVRSSNSSPNEMTTTATHSVSMVDDYELASTTDDDNNSTSANLLDSNLMSSVDRQNKSLTLPQPEVANVWIQHHHQRSMSESKTIDLNGVNPPSSIKMAIGKNCHLNRRIRNNSMTESTTSGVSSSESVGGGGGVAFSGRPQQLEQKQHHHQQQHLSPIPSSCSLTTINKPLRRRQNQKLLSSLTITSGSGSTSAPSYISYQDLLGYATLRNLNQQRNLSTGSIFGTDFLAWRDTKPREPLRNPFQSMADMKQVSSRRRNELLLSDQDDEQQRSYLGICLPQTIHSLFPNVTTQLCCSPNNAERMDEDINSKHYLTTTTTIITDANCEWRHKTQFCLKCCSVKEDSSDDDGDRCEFGGNVTFGSHLCIAPNVDEHCVNSVRLEIVRLVVYLANPLWAKQVKQKLFTWKQQTPHIFRDVCLYSECCRMLGECSYRMSARRLLHELWLELELSEMYIEATLILEKFDCSSLVVGAEVGATSPLPQQPVTLDSLRFAYKENKFPIRHRH